MQRGDESPAHLRGFETGQADLVERQVHVGVPVHDRDRQPEPAGTVVLPAIGDDARGELAKAVMESVDGLHGGRRVEERRVGQRSFSHVDEHPEAIGHVFVQGALEAAHQGVCSGSAIERRSVTVDANEWGAGRNEATEGRRDVKDAVTCDGELHQTVSVDGRQDPGVGCDNHVRIGFIRREVVRVVRVEQAPRVVADQLDQ